MKYFKTIQWLDHALPIPIMSSYYAMSNNWDLFRIKFPFFFKITHLFWPKNSINLFSLILSHPLPYIYQASSSYDCLHVCPLNVLLFSWRRTLSCSAHCNENGWHVMQKIFVNEKHPPHIRWYELTHRSHGCRTNCMKMTMYKFYDLSWRAWKKNGLVCGCGILNWTSR